MSRRRFATIAIILASAGAVISFQNFDSASSANCAALVPSTNAKINDASLAYCLSQADPVHLKAGIFPVSVPVAVQAGRSLSGTIQNGMRATIIAASPTLANAWTSGMSSDFTGNKVVYMAARARLSDLRVSSNGRLKLDCGDTECSYSVVELGGSNAVVSNVETFNLDPMGNLPTNSTEKLVTGMYFMGVGSDGQPIRASQVSNSFVHDVHRGVIFASSLTPDTANVFQNSEVFRTACDGVTLAGYGIVRSSQIHALGFDCKNGVSKPIPGAAIYSLDNQSGGVISGNQIFDVCGNGLDLVSGQKFVVTYNHVLLLGKPLGGQYSYCSANTPGSFVDVNWSTITSNEFRVSDVAPLGTFFSDFPAYLNETRGVYSVLPQAERQITAVKLIAMTVSMANTFDKNVMVATCTTAACIGTGMFASSRTGRDQGGNWSQYTTNYFTGNHVNGSNIGSVRCGANWYAGNSTCPARPSDASCNDDDYQHPTTNYRNDGC